MLTSSTLLRDPHTVLCFTLNSRGGFTPHAVEEFVVDSRYPGYLLTTTTTSSSSSSERWATLNQVRKENPEMFDEEEDGIMWVPPSSFASLHEQKIKRGIHRPNSYNNNNNIVSSSISSSSVMKNTITPVSFNNDNNNNKNHHRSSGQKKLVILMNEGTASSAEVFASALHDNGRTIALIGTQTYGKGLIQHTIPMQDGGGLRLTVAEYLTPKLQHVTKVGRFANYYYDGGAGAGAGGIRPDVYCPSREGIPLNVGADFCVGMALDVLDNVL